MLKMNIHIKELKNTIMYSLICWCLTTLIIYIHIDYILYHYYLILMPKNYTLIFTNLSEAFWIYIKFSLLLGLISCIPINIILYWLYISSALFEFEYIIIRNWIYFWIILLYPIIIIKFIPNILYLLIDYFSSFQSFFFINITFMHSLYDLYDWILNITIWSILIPIIMSWYIWIYLPLTIKKLSIDLNYSHLQLKFNRPLIYWFILLISAIITPPDIMSLILLSVIIILLLEIIIFVKCFIYCRILSLYLD
jgi:sec-independent protein translocase protein TatC